jgi:hypothetical protein
MLDMQEAAGSNPAPPTSHEFVLKSAFGAPHSAEFGHYSACRPLNWSLLGPSG